MRKSEHAALRHDTQKRIETSGSAGTITLTTVDGGKFFHNKGAAGATTYNLLTDAKPGDRFFFRNVAGQRMTLNPGASGQIQLGAVTGAAAATMSFATAGTAVTVVCVERNFWVATVDNVSPLVEAKTADYTVTALDNGKTFTTVGAAGTVVFALPAAVVGMRYRFRVGAAQELRLDPNGAETVALPSTGAQSAAGKYITANADGETAVVECTKAGEWTVFSYTGTWTAEA